MNTTLRRFTGILVTFVLGSLALAGCDAQKPEPASAASAPAPDISKTAAIQSAQRDAAYRYSEVAISRVDAYRHGGFWVVELTSQSGSGLRYTISALDGTIRERNSFQ